MLTLLWSWGVFHWELMVMDPLLWNRHCRAASKDPWAPITKIFFPSKLTPIHQMEIQYHDQNFRAFLPCSFSIRTKKLLKLGPLSQVRAHNGYHDLLFFVNVMAEWLRIIIPITHMMEKQHLSLVANVVKVYMKSSSCNGTLVYILEEFFHWSTADT